MPEKNAAAVMRFRCVSPAMVQHKKATRKMYEWAIASRLKCATIGTVLKKFLASHGTKLIHAPNAAGAKGQTNGNSQKLN
jgi:hypothetical protein